MRLSIALLLVSTLHGQLSGGLPFPGPGTPASSGGGTCTRATGYARCRVLTVDHNQVGGATLTNFPVLVQATLGSSRIQNANCYDVVYTSDSGGTTPVPWEQESCTQSTGAVIAWVLCASCSSNSNTNLYVSYDNASVSTAQNTAANGPTHLWDSFYTAVWHLPNGSTLTTNDSTSNAHNLTNNGSVSPTSGQIDGAALFSGSNHLDTASNSIVSGASQITVECWVNYTGVLNLSAWFTQYQNSAATLYSESSGTHVSLYLGASANSGSFPLPSGMTHFVMVYDGTQSTNATRLALYYNGAQQTATNFTGTIPASFPSITAPFVLADQDVNRFAGVFDEFRVSVGTARSVAWITASYNNQMTGSTFLSVGAEI